MKVTMGHYGEKSEIDLVSLAVFKENVEVLS